MLTRTIDFYRGEKGETIVSACGLFGASRQVYYRSKRSVIQRQSIAAKVEGMVVAVRRQMPRIGTRKLYYLLQSQLKDIGVGRDRLFSILKANHMLIKPKKYYRKTTDSYHSFNKHKTLIAGATPQSPDKVRLSDIHAPRNKAHQRHVAMVKRVTSTTKTRPHSA